MINIFPKLDSFLVKLRILMGNILECTKIHNFTILRYHVIYILLRHVHHRYNANSQA